MRHPLPSVPHWDRLLRLAGLAAVLGAVLLTWPRAGLAEQSSASDALAAMSRALERAQAAVVGIQVEAIVGARSASTLGKSRQGSGVVIDDDGLVLTIGYLVLEAAEVQLLTDDGRTVPAQVVGYDVATGFGLVRALAPLRLAPVALGQPPGVQTGQVLMVASGAGKGAAGAVSATRMVARRAFSGNWEYHIEGALFTSPPHARHSGAGLFDDRGELLGVGSLFVGNVQPDEAGAPPVRAGNMFVPVDLLRPILAEMRSQGRGSASARAWVGINCVERDGDLRVVRVSDDSPADVAGLQVGDRILRVDGQPVHSLAALWQSLWRGGVEREITLDIERNREPAALKVYSVDRAVTVRHAEGI